MIDPNLPQQAARLAGATRLGEFRSLAPLVGGANNRVFLLEAEHGAALLKVYFRHPDDPRDRLGAEYAFSRFAWDHGVRCVPEPLACDADAGLGLFEYVPGRLLEPEEVDESALDQAIEFFLNLNRDRQAPDAVDLPNSSEACFRLLDHVDLVRKRIERLIDLPVQADIDAAARTFVVAELAPVWAALVDQVEQRALAGRTRLTERLALKERCLSPSDFGYHNAILAADGRLRFVDFEYSGWDEPAKLICDFFCQPAIPAPAAAFERFASAVTGIMPHPDLHLIRTNLLLPVYRLKWCCIVLNEFLPAGGRRRQFAGNAVEQEDRKIRQLEKARGLLISLTRSHLSTGQAA